MVFRSAIGVAAFGAGRDVAAMAARGLGASLESGLRFAAELTRAGVEALGGQDQQAGKTESARGASQTDNSSAAVGWIEQQMAALRDRIVQTLAAAGIVLAQPVELVPDGRGGIAVRGAHPQAGRIEEALSRDLLLERDFTELARQVAGDFGGVADLSGFVLTVPAGRGQ
jgi:hypothetical protein